MGRGTKKPTYDQMYGLHQAALRTFRTPSYLGLYDGTNTMAHRIVLSSITKYNFVQG